MLLYKIWECRLEYIKNVFIFSYTRRLLTCPVAFHSVTRKVAYVLAVNAWFMYLCSNIFEPVYDKVQIESSLLSYWRRKDVCSETSTMASEPRSLSDLPDEIQLKILSHFGPEELCLNIVKVCKNGMFWLKMWHYGWNFLTNVTVLLISAVLPR